MFSGKSYKSYSLSHLNVNILCNLNCKISNLYFYFESAFITSKRYHKLIKNNEISDNVYYTYFASHCKKFTFIYVRPSYPQVDAYFKIDKISLMFSNKS